MSYKFYLKKLTSNELGYRNDKLVTGQIFYISKQAVSFFPSLSTSINNDSINLQISVDYRDHPIFVNMVYHNDKYNRIDGTRDESRIYLNRDVAPDDFFFRPNDIVIFEKISENYYSLKKIREGDFGFESLDELIKTSKLRGAHALLDDLIIN
jgi:hypothetical protein